MQKLTKTFHITVPSVPNFITVGPEKMSIAEFSEEELKAIGAEWTTALIKAARSKRKEHREKVIQKSTGGLTSAPELPPNQEANA